MNQYLKFVIYLIIGIASLALFGVTVTLLKVDLDIVFNTAPLSHALFKSVPLVMIGMCWVLSADKEFDKRTKD